MNKFEDLFTIIFGVLLAAIFMFLVGVVIAACVDEIIVGSRNIGLAVGVIIAFVATFAPMCLIFHESIKYSIEKIW